MIFILWKALMIFIFLKALTIFVFWKENFDDIYIFEKEL